MQSKPKAAYSHPDISAHVNKYIYLITFYSYNLNIIYVDKQINKR